MNVMKYNRQTPCIYNNLRVMYHGIPKNASTSVKNALYAYEHGHEFEGNKQWIHKGNEKGGSIYPKINQIDEYHQWFHFTVVRNPLDRFKSFYNDLFAGTTNIRHNVPPFYTDNKIELKPKPVDEVIEIVESFQDEEADEHFASQSSFIYCDVEIIKMEELSERWESITDCLGVEYKPLNVYNKSIDTVDLTAQQEKRLWNRYENDFTEFGYEVGYEKV